MSSTIGRRLAALEEPDLDRALARLRAAIKQSVENCPWSYIDRQCPEFAAERTRYMALKARYESHEASFEEVQTGYEKMLACFAETSPPAHDEMQHAVEVMGDSHSTAAQIAAAWRPLCVPGTPALVLLEQLTALVEDVTATLQGAA